MTLFLLAVAAGLLAGWTMGGRLGQLAGLRLRAPTLVALALALQVGAGVAASGWRLALVAVSYLLAGAWLGRNLPGRSMRLRAGLALLALGWALNLAAMIPHQGMPVSSQALHRVGAPLGADVGDGHLSKHVRAHASAVSWLGDVIPVRPLKAVISIGDLALLAGVGLCVAGAMTLGPGGDDHDPDLGPGVDGSHPHLGDPEQLPLRSARATLTLVGAGHATKHSRSHR